MLRKSVIVVVARDIETAIILVLILAAVLVLVTVD